MKDMLRETYLGVARLREYAGYGELFTRKKHGFQKCDF
jgi:hypothetical protein